MSDTDRSPRTGQTPPSATKTGEVRVGLGAKLRAYLFAGILITAPISITFYVAWLFVSLVDSRVTALIPERYNPTTYLPFGLPGLGLLIAIVALILIGALTAGFFGRLVVRFYEGLLSRTPVLRSIYGASKQIIETVLAHQSSAFRQAVLVEYPRRGIWSIGFLTGVTKGEVQELTDEQVLNVFLPTTPNPTSGYLLFVPRRDLVYLTMSVEDALKMVISGGIVTPPERPGRAVPAGVGGPKRGGAESLSLLSAEDKG